MSKYETATRSHVMDRSLALAPVHGETRNKRGVLKNRFKHPLVTKMSEGGKSVRVGKWKCGHRHNPNSR